MTRPEAARLIDGCEAPHIRLFVLLALQTAARAAAILELTWERVDLEQRRIDFRLPGRASTKKGRAQVPINDTLLEALRVASEARTTNHVIEWAGGQVASIKTGFRAAATRAKLAQVTPHTLRHTAATWMAQKGVPWWEIAGMMGHTSPRMLEETYGHHHPDHLSHASAALG
ncbi:site-specific integrase [Lichenicola sp.]|uniref:site-specific integrase n=1 Tax=Lichenicola sp. TaxID=2804529 RepID=UPI003AFFD2DC